MLKACAYCGRIHARGIDCGKRPKRICGSGGAERKFRSSSGWTQMSIQIRKRDKYLCVYCMIHDNRITREDIEVHHIVPVRENYDKRLDGDNLISLCREHHEAAEAGMIKRDVLMLMAEQQEAEQANEIVCL